MPIFMDRHDMRDMTAESVAEAHRKDLAIQDKYDVRYMTYWFDQRRGTGFCLVDAPDAATAEQVHREAHGEIPTDIIAVDLAAVEAFLSRIGDPEATPGATVPERDAGLRAVMFTDRRLDRDDGASWRCRSAGASSGTRRTRPARHRHPPGA